MSRNPEFKKLGMGHIYILPRLNKQQNTKFIQMASPQFKAVLILIALTTMTCNSLTDIRNDYLKKGITEEDRLTGQVLLQKMQIAHGGIENWEKYQFGEFTQKADWYGRLSISHWDTLPQLYSMVCDLRCNDAKMTLLNGVNKGVNYHISGDDFFIERENEERQEISPDRYFEKMVFKSYWFQFPFKISEAAIVSYGGQEEISGKTYDIVYATWGSEKPNNEFDQFLLYLDVSTHRLEILHFTVRDKFKKISMTAEFKNFKKVDEFFLAHSQFVRQGKPANNGLKFHENHYEEMKFYLPHSSSSLK